jgi:CTP-dependent riboflavin kinase
LKGTVFSGRGEGAKFISLQWVRKQIREQLGFSPYAGTLNLRLVEESRKTKTLLTRAAGLKIVPASGFYPGKLFRARVMNVECAVIIPQVPGYSKNVIELVSSVSLKDKLDLVDGSTCEVSVTI